jgi:hypothetical protein
MNLHYKAGTTVLFLMLAMILIANTGLPYLVKQWGIFSVVVIGFCILGYQSYKKRAVKKLGKEGG